MTAVTVTRRRWRTWRAKRVAFLDWQLGAGVDEQGPFAIPPRADLADLLRGLPGEVERVMVTGPRIGETPDGLRAWLAEPGRDWVPGPEGHYLEDLGQFTLRYVGPNGRRVAIHRAASWFGEGAYGPEEALAAWRLLRASVARNFDGGELLATPATTGRDLFVRSLGEHVYPLASAEHQALIRSTTGQGRIELLEHPRRWALAHPGGGSESDLTMPGLAEYDGRLMYGALCWGLGSGVLADQSAAGPAARAAFAADFAANPQARARYQILFRVPSGWDHVGLAGVWTGSGWTYPSRPDGVGVEHETWVDGSELMLLARHGWPFAICRRLVLNAPPRPGPLDLWARKLSSIRLGLADVGASLAAAGARSILLHSIGAFMGRPHVVTRTAPITETRMVPADAVGLRIEGETLVWGERRPTAWPELSHPEWSAAIWARCRARLLSGPGGTGALHVPASNVVAFRTDALYLTRRQPWPDDGKVGRLRLASWTPGPLPWPATQADLLKIRNEARSNG